MTKNRPQNKLLNEMFQVGAFNQSDMMERFS